MNSKSTGLRIIRKDIDGKMDLAFTEPDEPAPVFLIRLNGFVTVTNRRQQLVHDKVSADAALVDVLVGRCNVNTPGEGQFVRHLVVPYNERH